LSDIVLDPEFRDLIQWPGQGEHGELREFFARDGGSDGLIVWNCGGRLVLLIGYVTVWQGDACKAVVVR
jgi:hypothetical protein